MRDFHSLIEDRQEMYTQGKTMQQIQTEQHEDNLRAVPNVAEVRLKGDRATDKEKDVAA